MTKNYLLATNALSEVSKKEPNVGFMEWFMEANELMMFTSCLVLGEIKKGIALSPDANKRKRFDAMLTEIIEQFDGRIVDINSQVAFLWGELVAIGQQSGKTPPTIDALIAAQCISNDLILVTRNTEDFKQFKGLQIHAPWTV